MLINADFLSRAELTSDKYDWVPSPQGGVKRVMLDRVGAEKARATSLVRYAPNSYFPHHEHPGGEEILVLQGTFSADDTHYPAGWYLRNPPGSGHKPYSGDGAVIFVKLRQMPLDENRYVAIDTNDAKHWQTQDGRDVCALFSDSNEQVSLQRLAAGESLFSSPVEGGAEILVLSGNLLENGQSYGKDSWLRLPPKAQTSLQAGDNGAMVYLKTGHLAHVIGL